MRIDQTLAAVLLAGFGGGQFRNPPSITDGNRWHQDRAPRGSQIEAERMAAAQAKRDRKRARSAAGTEGKS